MTQRENEIWSAIASVLNGTGTEEQYLLLNTWLGESEENKKTFEVLSKVRRIKKSPTEAEKEKIFENIHSEIRKSKKGRYIWLRRYGNIASVLIIVALSIALLWQKSDVGDTYIETRCPLGTKSKVTLSDGTIVHLNSGSVLKYPSSFSGGLREVKLRGEAFFEVVHERNRNFLVDAGEINIKVFGTSFNIKNYEADKAIETTLVEGKVSIIRKDGIGDKQAMVLKPNQQAVYEKQTGKLFSRNLDAELVSIWKEGKYYFENETFEAIAHKLEREFNIPVVIASEELRKEIFSGMFDKNKTIYQMLDLMKRGRDFTYKEAADTIVITKK